MSGAILKHRPTKKQFLFKVYKHVQFCNKCFRPFLVIKSLRISNISENKKIAYQFLFLCGHVTVFLCFMEVLQRLDLIG